MRLSQRIRRDLGLANDVGGLNGAVERVEPDSAESGAKDSRAAGEDGSTQLIQRLRRQIARMERPARPRAREQWADTGAVAPSPSPSPVSDSPPASRRGPAPDLSAAQLLHRHDYEIDAQHGAASLGPPGAVDLVDIGRLLCLERQPQSHLPLESAAQLLFLDTETTGLSRGAGTLAFVIGLGGFWGEAGAFQVDQIVLHDPAREAEGLAVLSEYLTRARVLVSFNGRSFDLPVLRNRALLNGIHLALDRPHLDLLPWCRRHFRARLSDCRLGTVERQLLGFFRHDDLPGSEAPAVYQDYLREGDFSQMQRLLEHNRDDLASLPALLARLTRHVLDPLQWGEDGEELLATGLYQLSHGDASLGEACLHRSLELSRWPATRRRALTGLAGHCRRQQRKAEAAGLWERYREEFPRCQVGWVELAKHHEHTTKDLERALALTEAAPDNMTSEIAHRRERLQRRLARQAPR